jgi:hypothetical protein
MDKDYLKIMTALGWPPIFMIHHRQFEMLEGEEKKEENRVNDFVVGIAAWDYPVFTIHPWLEGKERENVIWHEIAHHLWPWQKHWWIEMFAEKMTGGGGRGVYSKKYKKRRGDLPPKAKLLEMARRQANRLKERYKIIRPLG